MSDPISVALEVADILEAGGTVGRVMVPIQ
jgi:hypothetical protein